MRKLIAGAAVMSAACSVFGSSSDPDAPPSTGDDGGADGGTITGVPGAEAFTLSVPPDTTFLVAGSTVDVTVTAQRGALLTDAIDVTLNGLPAGIMPLTFTVPANATQAKLTLQATSDAPQGPATVTLAGVSGKATGSATLNLFVRGKPGAVDTTFGTKGSVTVSYPGVSAGILCSGSPQGLFVDAADRVYALAFSTVPGDNSGTCAERLAPDGQVDTSYAISGNLPFMVRGVGYAYPDGRVLFATSVTSASSVSRLDATGHLDAAFGTGGSFAYAGSAHPTQAITVRKDGVVFVATTSLLQGRMEAFVYALTDSGTSQTLPNGFNFFAGTFSTSDVSVCGVAVRPTNEALVTGYTASSYGAFQVDAKAQNYDPTFDVAGTKGQFSAAWTAGGCGGPGLLLPDGSYIFSLTGAASGNGLYKIQANGTIDPSWGGGGYVAASSPGTIARDPNGNIVVAATPRSIMRFTATGVPDTSFGANGQVVLDGDTGMMAALQKDGRILSAGRLADGTLSVTRLWN